MYMPISDSIGWRHRLCDRASAEEAVQPGEKLCRVITGEATKR
jgi:hypothetical protein